MLAYAVFVIKVFFWYYYLDVRWLGYAVGEEGDPFT